MPAPSYSLKRVARRFLATGPWRAWPLDRLLHVRTDELRAGMEMPESFAGLLDTVPTPPQFYRDAAPLFQLAPPSRQTLSADPRFLPGGFAPGYQTRVWTLSDAIISGQDGVVWCPRLRTAVAETARGWTLSAYRHPLFGAVRAHPLETLHGLCMHLASPGSENFYHFLNESLARLAFVSAWRDRFDWYVVSGPRTAGREAWLEAAGVPLAKVVWLKSLQSVRCAQLVATDFPLPTACPTPRHVERLRALFGHRPSTPSRTLWISRSDASVRHLAWEDQLLAHLPGVEKIRLADHSATRQINLFSTARAIIAPHGAGLANLAWVPPGGALVELFPPDKFIDPGYGRWCDAVGWRHTWACLDFSQPSEPARLASLIAKFVAH